MEKEKKGILQNAQEAIAKNVLGKNACDTGKKVWFELDAKLPQAVGAIVNDEPRVTQFKQMVQQLSFTDKYALCAYLKQKIHEFTYERDDFLTGREEQYISKWTQIYQQHLDAIA